MTIVFSAATPRFIVMTVDMAVVETSQNRTTYKRGRKSIHLNRIGCIATWGALDGNTLISQELDLHRKLRAGEHTFDDLVHFAKNFLETEFRPDERRSSDVGYHIAGFDRSGRARLYHLYWGIPRPNPDHDEKDYRCSDHSPSEEQPLVLVYNGRNDIAATIIGILIREIHAGKDIRIDLTTSIGIARLGDFVARMAAELTPEVGPPFITYFIFPGNIVLPFKNESFAPICLDDARLNELLSLSRVSPEPLHLAPLDATPGHQTCDTPASVSIFHYSSSERKLPQEHTGGTVTPIP